jgi:hypothetical protein
VKFFKDAAPEVFGAFFTLAALVAGVGAITLVVPDGPLEFVWVAKQNEFAELLAHRAISVPGFLLLFIACTAAAIGCLLRYRWGWWLALTLISINLLASVIRLADEPSIGLALGAVIAALLVTWLVTSRPQFC